MRVFWAWTGESAEGVQVGLYVAAATDDGIDVAHLASAFPGGDDWDTVALERFVTIGSGPDALTALEIKWTSYSDQAGIYARTVRSALMLMQRRGDRWTAHSVSTEWWRSGETWRFDEALETNRVDCRHDRGWCRDWSLDAGGVQLETHSVRRVRPGAPWDSCEPAPFQSEMLGVVNLPIPVESASGATTITSDPAAEEPVLFGPSAEAPVTPTWRRIPLRHVPDA